MTEGLKELIRTVEQLDGTKILLIQNAANVLLVQQNMEQQANKKPVAAGQQGGEKSMGREKIKALAENILKKCEQQGLTMEETEQLPAALKILIANSLREQKRQLKFEVFTNSPEGQENQHKPIRILNNNQLPNLQF